MTRSTGGKIWVSRDGRISALEHGQLRPLEFNEAATNTYVLGIGASGDGGLWVASDERIRKWKDGKWVADLGSTPWGGNVVTRWIETEKGVLAVGTVDLGLYLMLPSPTGKVLHFDHAGDFPSDWVSALCEDAEGSLWAGTGNGGMVMLRPSPIETITPPDHWQRRAVLSVYPDSEDGLWIGTEGAGLYHYQEGEWTNFGSGQGIRNAYVWSLTEDQAGRLWAGTWGGGLFRQDGDHFEFAPGMENITLPMPALLRGRADVLWIGTADGLLRYQAGRLTWFKESQGGPLRDVRTAAEDGHGAVWFGMAGGGLACLNDNRIQRFRTSDGLSSEFIECLHFDQDGVLWIGTFGGGLNRYKDGRFAVINRKEGLPNGVIGHIEEDSRGFFWMSTHAGIIRVRQAELNRCADGKTNEVHCQVYGINDGLPTIECSEGLQPAGCQTADGRLWFPTSKGLVAVNPRAVPVNRLPPPVIIETMRVDGQPLAGAGTLSSSLTVPAGRHRFEFQYTGLSFVDPEKVQFQYRLEGLENDWMDAGPRRTVNYNYIPPGSYTFRVTACNNDGVWSERGAGISFVVLPLFWQTVWFRILAGVILVVASGGLVWFDTRRRMRRRLERLERQRAIERERARIAKDIHDDLGASLTRITMLSESARSEQNVPNAVASNLNRIYGIAGELTRAMDEIVWAVNPHHDTLDSLASYLSRFAQEFLAPAGIRCRLDVPMQLPAWPVTAEVRHNLFLAFKEALHNVVKHSSASEVHVSLALRSPGIILAIEDDGRGFAVPELNEGAPPKKGAPGDGLLNMKKRLAEIGGHCEIQSAPGQGTKIQLLLPAKISIPGDGNEPITM
jgi:signal transduction histidine kinase